MTWDVRITCCAISLCTLKITGSRFVSGGRQWNWGFTWAVPQLKNGAVLLNPSHIVIYRSHHHCKLYRLNYWRIFQINNAYISWRKVVCIIQRNCIAPLFIIEVFLSPNKTYFVNSYRSRATNMATTQTFEASRTPFLAKTVAKKL